MWANVKKAILQKSNDAFLRNLNFEYKVFVYNDIAKDSFAMTRCKSVLK